MRVIDLRGDSVTPPTPEMRKAMFEAEVGDDVFGEDSTTPWLEAMAAQLMGKEAAALVASSTQGNLVSVLSHCQRGEEIIVGDKSHIFVSESGHYSALGGICARPVPNDARGRMDPEALERAMWSPDAFTIPRTVLVCLENAHNVCSGAALTPQDTAAVAEVAHRRGLRLHLDGCFIFNAAVALGVPTAELARHADSVVFSLSKTLCCPLGALVCGSRQFIAQVRKYRLMLGASMRKGGIIAAAGIVALETMVDRLAEDHANAKKLAAGLASMPSISLPNPTIQTQMVVVEVHGRSPRELVDALAKRGVLAYAGHPFGLQQVRFVTHYGITASDIETALDAIETVARQGAEKA